MSPVNFKLINLLKSLSAKEINQFKKFVSSPFYTKGRNYLLLLNHLLKYTEKGFENVNVKEFYNSLYPNKTFNNQTLKNRFSELYKLGEEFLVYAGLEQNKFEKNNILLKMFVKKKLYSPFESKYKKVLKTLETEKYDNKKIETLALMHELNIDFLKERNKIQILFNQYFEYSQINLCSYLIRLFVYGIEFALQEDDNRKYESNYVVDILKKLDLKEIMKSFSKSNSIIYKVTSMNYYLYKAYENTDKEEYYFASHTLFNELSGELDEDYKIQIFNHLMYYCIKKQNLGIKKFQYELFNLYNEKLKQGLFSDLQEKVYLFNNFRDYVYIGISVKEYKWVDNFIKRYSKELPDKFREDEIKLSYAKLNFAFNNFDKSLLNLNNIKTTNYLQYIDSSSIKLCSYFELENFEDAFKELDKLKHYIRNHKEIPKIHKVYSENFTRTYQKLIRIHTQPEKKEIEFLQKEINETKLILKKEWLLEKISNIID